MSVKKMEHIEIPSPAESGAENEIKIEKQTELPIDLKWIILIVVIVVIALLSLGALIGFVLSKRSDFEKAINGFAQGCGSVFAVLLIIPVINWVSKKADKGD